LEETSTAPLVSVVIPAYNGSNTIEQSIRSVLAQDLRTEIIVVDDSSSDQTLTKAIAILTSGSNSYKIVRHPTNLGLSASLNDGLAIAHGENVLVLHQDCELMKPDWISSAVKCMDPKVGVVTGYYGMSDQDEMNLAKKTFGLLRRQIHPRPAKDFEIVNFSEGKCDLYKKRVLESIGGFPTRYRIAGEDLSVSVQLRQRGYSILKQYNLPVLQRYGGKAQSFRGNLRKEFEFGRAMGGILGEHRFRIFEGVGKGYARARTTHRAAQVAYTTLLFLSALAYLSTMNPWFLVATLSFLSYRYVYYALTISSGFRNQRSLAKHSLIDTLWMPFLGMLSDPIYSLGFLWGLLKWKSGRTI